jgi:TolB protein
VVRHSLFTLSLLLAGSLGAGLLFSATPPGHAQAPAEVWLNVQRGGATKLQIAVPAFTVASGGDAGVGKTLADVAAKDLAFTGLFSVVAGTSPLPPDDPEGTKKLLTEFATAGAHAALGGIYTQRGDRADAEMRLYDLTNPEQRVIARKTFELPAAQSRRLAHKIADEVMLQFTGELGSADTRIAYVRGRPGGKELYAVDYDGFGATSLTSNGSINLSPVWSPDARSLAFTSYMKGYPDLYRVFVDRRPVQTLASFVGINSSPAWSPDGRSLALTLSKDGNAEIYVLNVATGTTRRLTRHIGIDSEPTWSPTGRQLAFVSDRQGEPHIYVMDGEGTNVRQISRGGFHTQPRWSPRGDVIAFTTRRGGVHSIWIVGADGSNPRRLDTGSGDAESASWSPDGRHLAFQMNRTGAWQVYTMRADGSDQRQVAGPDATSPSWSPRLP